MDEIKWISLKVKDYGLPGQSGWDDLKRLIEIEKWLSRKENYVLTDEGCFCFNQLAPQSSMTIFKWLKMNLEALSFTAANGCVVHATIVETHSQTGQQFTYQGYVVL